MGESKRRKATEPGYGKPKQSTVRGLIINNPMFVGDDEFGTNNPQLDKLELRASLLYWDRLALPKNNIISVQPDADVQFLISSGIILRPEVSVSGSYSSMGRILATIPSEVLRNYEKEQPGMWSLGGGQNSILVKVGEAQETEGTLITLYNALPAPTEEVPLAEILEFKQLRRPELLALRAHFDSLSEKLNSSSGMTEELTYILRDIDTSCSNLSKVCREWQSPIYLTNLEANLNFNIGTAFASGGAAWKGIETFGLGLTAKTIGATVAAIQSQISFKPGIKFRSFDRGTSPYKYVYEAEKRLF